MSSEAVAPPQPEKAVPQRIFRLPREIGILGALGLMLLVLAVFIPQFRDLQNITNITRNFSFVGIVAMGMTLVILTGGIDLSVGSVWGMTAVIVAFLLTHGWPVLLAILVSLLAAAGIGLMNGLCITRLKMSPFVPTLATLSIARSFALIVTHGRPISIFGDEYQSFLWLGGGDIFGIPNPFIIFCITADFLLDPPFAHSVGALRLRGWRKRENGAFDGAPRRSTEDHRLYLVRGGRGDRRASCNTVIYRASPPTWGPEKNLLSSPRL